MKNKITDVFSWFDNSRSCDTAFASPRIGPPHVNGSIAISGQNLILFLILVIAPERNYYHIRPWLRWLWWLGTYRFGHSGRFGRNINNNDN